VIVYKFVELSVVTDETLEKTVNGWVRRGWAFEGVRFVVTDHSRRPAMAFVSFVREAGPGDVAVDDDSDPDPVVRVRIPDEIDTAPIVRKQTPPPAPIELGEIELPVGDAPVARGPRRGGRGRRRKRS